MAGEYNPIQVLCMRSTSRMQHVGYTMAISHCVSFKAGRKCVYVVNVFIDETAYHARAAKQRHSDRARDQTTDSRR